MFLHIYIYIYIYIYIVAQGIDYWMMKEGIWSRLCTVPTSQLNLCRWQMTLRRWRVVVLSTDGEKVLMEMDCGNNK
jgi:hypothetical protein